MKTEKRVTDTGPIVAYLDVRDRYHVWACQRLDEADGPLLTCEPVLVEVYFLLKRAPHLLLAFESMLQGGFLKLEFSLSAELTHVLELRRKYASVPMSLADASLVRLCELHPGTPLLTLDSDFRIYRQQRDQEVPAILPD